MSHLLLFGPGYCASHFARQLEARGWQVTRVARQAGDIGFDDRHAVLSALRDASHILSSVPPDAARGDDPVLRLYGEALALGSFDWVGYLSSTGVYGDAAGAWVDESAPIQGRRGGRNAADADWCTLHPAARIFRLPGIYGPGRSALDRLAAGAAHRIGPSHHIFSRIHVADVAGALIASLRSAATGPFNIADDCPSHPDAPICHAARLLGQPPPPITPIASLSPAAQAFYRESRRIANGRAKRLLGWQPRHPTYVSGLNEIYAQSHAAPSTPD